jgi:flagellar biosynthetic protein FliR
VKLMIAIGLTLALTPSVGQKAATTPVLGILATMLIGEILTGVFIGLAARIVLSAVQIAGNVIAMQLGLSYAMSIDPAQGSQGAIIGTFLSLLALTLIFASDLHHLLIGVIRHSYNLFPAGQAIDTRDMADLALKYLSSAFALGMQLAAPFLVFGVIFQVASGILSRLMPQVQIFFLTVPVTILAGLTILMFCLSAMMLTFLGAFAELLAPLAGG